MPCGCKAFQSAAGSVAILAQTILDQAILAQGGFENSCDEAFFS